MPLLHFGSLVFSKVMLSGRKTELKSVGLALRQRCPLLSIVPPLAVCGEGDSQAHPARSVSWLCLSPCTQGSRGCLTVPEVAEDAWEVMGWWGCPCAWWGCCWEALLWDPAVTTNYGVSCSLVATLSPPKGFLWLSRSHPLSRGS